MGKWCFNKPHTKTCPLQTLVSVYKDIQGTQWEQGQIITEIIAYSACRYVTISPVKSFSGSHVAWLRSLAHYADVRCEKTEEPILKVIFVRN